MDDKPFKCIPDEDNPWYCPNCGRPADAEMRDEQQVISCRVCESTFEVITVIVSLS